MPPLPFEPEPIDQLHARYRDAMTPIWDGEAINQGTRSGIDTDRPGKHRRHTFDLREPVGDFRVIVSVETHSRLGTCLHISASCSAYHGSKLLGPVGLTSLLADVVNRIARDEWLKTHCSGEVCLRSTGILHIAIELPPPTN